MNQDKKAASSPDQEQTSAESLVLDLNFVPAWARQPPSPDPYLREAPREKPARPDRREGRGRDRRQGKGRGERGADRRPARGDNRQPRGDRQGPRPERGRREPVDRGPGNRRGEREDHEPLLPIQVSFLPEQDRLGAVMADIRAAQHAFPLRQLAHLFLDHPGWHRVKFEANKKTGGVYIMTFYQSGLSGLLFADQADAQAAVLEEALRDCFESETVQKDAPAGNYVCVARCRLSGTLLGPPNFHGYQQALEELYRSRFAQQMSMDAYRRQIETVREPERIEQWKEEWSRQTHYRLKPDYGGSEEAAPMAAKEARAYAEQHVVPKQVKAVKRAVLSGRTCRDIHDPRVLRVLRAAWAREQRHPASLVRALRGASRRMGMHLFETKDGSVFVTGIAPKPVDPARVVETIREVLEWLRTHPGCSRQELIAGVRPDAGDDPAQMGVVLQPLRWLIEKGHVIEFHNGTLAIPKDTPAGSESG